MKKIFFILSSVLFLTSSTELHELIRLPLLVEHYSRHRLADPGLSFLAFMTIHYSEDHPDDKDDNEDNELPFKSNGSLAHVDTAVPFQREADERSVSRLTKKLIIRYADDIPDNGSFSIFHPPRHYHLLHSQEMNS